MKRGRRIALAVCSFILLFLSWFIVANSKSASQKQAELLETALELIGSGIYVRAVPLLEEAAQINTEHTMLVEEYLKESYIALINTRGYRKKYRNLLDIQMSREGADAHIFIEAANHYLEASQLINALEILRTGIRKTGNMELIALYENNRYVYDTNRNVYEYASEIYESKSQVVRDGLWGIASADGILLIPCEYERISTFSVDRVIVEKDGEIFAVNIDNNRIAILDGVAYDFRNFGNERIGLLFDDGWRRVTGEFEIGSAVFEDLGMYNGGYAAAKIDGYWGVIDVGLNWYITAQYDEVILDELGRCYGQNAVFVKSDGNVCMINNGEVIEGIYEDARPFGIEGYAAVMRNGKWGYIDTEGNIIIDFIYDDALSYSSHLAAVKVNDYWGYISLSGDMVIEPIYEYARGFYEGSAAVLTSRGWQFITLLEYRKGMGF
ncbi:MAG: WG repeat-containing protein [Oscillospiraceae bacterium]|nr:WG repeat-containing protein [Oscillospiraceae bacterium]